MVACNHCLLHHLSHGLNALTPRQRHRRSHQQLREELQSQQLEQQQQPHKSESEPAQGAASVATVKSTAHQPNGHVQADSDYADVTLINGIMQQVQLCNGHGKEEDELMPATAQVAPTVNGHANKSTAINNNNHINDNNNISSSTNSNNNNDVNSIISSSSNRNKNNNNHSNSNNSRNSSSKAKNNNKTLATVEAAADVVTECGQQKHEPEQEQQTTDAITLVATSKSTANTQTTSATKTKTTAMAIATRGSVHDEAPSTSAAAAAAEAAAVAAATLLQHQLQLEPAISADEIVYKEYEAEHQMHDIMRLIQAELSEPYSIYTYRYFIYNWPKLCFLASHDNQYVGAIVCKLDMHMNVRRGYIAMLAVRKEYRKLKIGTRLVTKAIEAMLADNADEVVLETEMRNEPALRLYENLGFVRDKRLFRYYLNGVDALRLKLWFR
ncbi:GH12823 [Drosophila grimshawi]|uniref:N-terminal methionine N(alpha)-acetyltransferase NatC n=1 Tax=Drosophila grimshawi TaxID=7222 RepID=B4JLA9_DROGR|nr:GH12823 [Drosophila grimshawi]